MGDETVEPVRIGIQEIYDLCRSLDTKIDTYIGMQEPRLVLLDHRLGQVESKLKIDDARWEAKVKETNDRRWQVTLAFIAALLSISGTVVLALLQLKGV